VNKIRVAKPKIARLSEEPDPVSDVRFEMENMTRRLRAIRRTLDAECGEALARAEDHGAYPCFAA
jgi:hypothetical protein